jgi:outer membrane protein OmpA-like peptidoglycan-associated protein
MMERFPNRGAHDIAMSRHRLTAACSFVWFLLLVPVSHAGLTDKLKKKAEEKAEKKVEEVVAEEAPADAAAGEPAAAEPAGEPSSEKVSAVSTKFDYVPGDKVLLADDFGQDELGEFPARWKLAAGTFEVAEKDGEHWLRCTSVDGRVRMKLPAMTSLPEFWTLEFDFWGEEPMGSALTVRALGAGDATIWEATFPQGQDMAFRTGDIFATTPWEGPSIGGRHHVMFMARGAALKAYMETQRMVNVPEVSAASGPVTDLEIRLWASTHPMITNVRFAEGCRPPKDMLAEGKLVTYGIRFPSGSDVVLPESAPVLRQVAAYMEANAAVKLRITGHTDSMGTPESNLDLSKRRSAAVAKVLSEQFGIAADRFATDGKGDTEAVASNDKPEGRAMNRRVEFAKL